jgi:hypothetical protein
MDGTGQFHDASLLNQTKDLRLRFGFWMGPKTSLHAGTTKISVSTENRTAFFLS